MNRQGMGVFRLMICVGLATGGVLLGQAPAIGTPATGQSWRAVRLLSSGPDGLVLEASGQDFGLATVVLDGQVYQRVDLPGGLFAPEPGSPAVPVLGELVGVPPGAQVTVEVVAGEYDEIPDVDLIPIPRTEYLGIGSEQRAVLRYERNNRVYDGDGFYPGQQALVTQTGMLRDQRVAGISLRPIQYNPSRKVLRVARRLRVRVRFVAASGVRPMVNAIGAPVEPEFEPVYRKALLNAEQSRGWRSRGRGQARPLRKAAPDWYDPLRTYHKVRVREDGVYRLDLSWFADSGINLAQKDLDHLKLYLDGVEVPLDVRVGGDGRLDEGEAITFEGKFRRASDRDFEHEFGRDNVYWLTFDGEPGLRFRQVDAAPDGGLPGSLRFRATVHAEVDSLYDPLGYAEDALRDHWYWGRTGSPLPGMAEYPVRVPVALPGLDRAAPSQARIRTGMHGLSLLGAFDPDHRTVVRLQDGHVVSEDRWDGQTPFVASGDAPVAGLADTVWVTVATPGFEGGPDVYVDHVLVNWIEVAYPRRYEATDGVLYFRPDESGRRALSIDGFTHPSVLVYELENGLVLEGVEVTAVGQVYRAELAAEADGVRYVAVDSGAMRRPDIAVRDVPSSWHADQEGAEYVVLTHSSFRDAADELAEHRRSGGLSATVVDIEDLYDEFAFGQVDPSVIRAFVAQAFTAWLRRPVYLMLLGRASYDYRDIFGEARTGRKNYIPALPFQRLRRGLAYTDHPFGMIGEDGFQDLAVGRFSVTRQAEAETVVRKVVAYDQAADERWRDRVLYMANHESAPIYTGPSDSLAAHYTEPLGLETFRVYNKESTPPDPNDDSREVIRQINEGRLVVNYAGHGSAGMMAYYLRGTSQQTHYNYMVQIRNAERLPIVMAMSCLNGLYADPTLICLAEEMTNKPNGGAIAYVSASSLAFLLTNDIINREMFRHTFQDSVAEFGKSLAMAKDDWLTAFPASLTSIYGMNLMGDPAQALAIPRGPDFVLAPDALSVPHDGALSVGDSILVRLRIENWGVVPETGVEVVLVARNLDRVREDTLFVGTLPPFGQVDSLAAVWRPGVGNHRLEALVDPSDRIREMDESNNRVEIGMEVLGSATAIPTMPRDNQVMVASGVRLAIRVSDPEAEEIIAEFEISATESFEGGGVIRSGRVTGEDGFVAWQPAGLIPGVYRWRARALDGETAGAWNVPQTLVVAASVPERDLLWQQAGDEGFDQGTAENLSRKEDGSVGRVGVSPPMRFSEETREGAFTAAGMSGTAVLCTDGIYLYVKGYFTPNSIYPGTDVFQRIGTGSGGTVAGQNYGVLAEEPVRGISATYHSDGFIYAEDTARDELVRISPNTGAIDHVRIPAGLLAVESGLSMNGHSLITSDGTHIYNVAYGVDGIPRAGWTVRVFDPSDSWRVVREYTVDPTSTGFSYLYTDGVIADGRFLYLVEFGTGLTHRVRVVDAEDGRVVAEYESDQAETDILSGQYDWVNNQVWFGQLNGSQIVRYDGRRLPDFGSLTSGPIGPAGAWTNLGFSLAPGSTSASRWELDILGEDPTGAFVSLPDWTGLSFEGERDLAGLDARRIRLRLRLYGGPLDASPGLQEWAVRYQPQAELALSGIQAQPQAVEEAQSVRLTVEVRNQGPLDRVLGAVVGFYSGSPEGGRLIGRTAVPEETPFGSKRSIPFVWNTARFGGRHFVTARVEDLQGRPLARDARISAADPVEVSPSGDGDVPEVELAALDAAGEVRPGDFLPSEPRFQVVFRDSSGIDPASVRLVMTGPTGETEDDIASSAVQDRTDSRTSLSFIYTPELEDGEHNLEVSARDWIGNGPARKAMAFRVSSDLQIERVLNVPNPVVDGTTFTYILSRPASVTVRIHTLHGRLVRRLDNLSGRAGYNQVFWDGRDAGGHPLANGVYLYTVTAEDGSGKIRVKERLVVYR